MAGTSPYLPEQEDECAKQPFRITFLPMNESFEIAPEDLPFGRDGRPGSILDIALGHDLEIEHACGGVCACSTCHVIVRDGFDTCGDATEEEEDMLDNAPGLAPTSRLACQAVPDGSVDLVVEIPEWNRNLAKEAPH